jgi:large subunit ribosomal protein L7A
LGNLQLQSSKKNYRRALKVEVLKDSKKAVGIKQSLKAVEDGNAKCVFLAKDADERIVSAIKELCAKKSIDVVYVDGMKLLGKACNIEVGAAAVALLK